MSVNVYSVPFCMIIYKFCLTLLPRSHTIMSYPRTHIPRNIPEKERKFIMSEMEYTPDILTLEDEEGNESAFEVIDTMELDGKIYVALTPYFENPEDMLDGDAELVVLVSEEVDGEEFLASIDDDDEYERVGNIFMERLAEYDEEEDEE